MNLTRAIVAISIVCSSAAAQEWTRFRGPDGQGIARAEGLPSTFTEANVLWRSAGGNGHSSPVLWGDRLFFTREGAEEGAREVVCMRADDGRELWASECNFEPHHQHRLNSFATSTPAVDDHGVYVVWTTGSDLTALCLDHDGDRRWRRRIGSFRAQHGSGGSPVVHDGLVIFANDQDGDGSFVVALDRETGEERWKIDRRSVDRRTCYGAPVTYRPDGGDPVLVFASTSHGLTGVDPASGEVRWEIELGVRNRFVATPGLCGDLLLCNTGSGGSGKECVVVRLPGDEGEPKVLHRPRRNIPYVPSPLGLDGRFYLFTDAGMAICMEAATGEEVWRERLEAGVFSSPVSVGGVIHLADREGTLWTLKPGDRLDVLGKLDLGAPVFATPAIAGGRMFVRTATHVICLGQAAAGKDG